MKVLIAGSIIGNEGYEEELLVKAVENELKSMEHMVDTFLLPFSRNFLTAPDQILAYRLIDVHECELLITVGYPACLLGHSNKVSYLFETLPHYWEYWDTEYGILCNNQYANIRNTLNEIDKKILSSTKKIYCNSDLLVIDLKNRLNIIAEELYCPSLNENKVIEQGKFSIITETTLLPYERPELIIELAKNLKNFNVGVFVLNSSIEYIELFENQIKQNKLNEKITIINQAIPKTVYTYSNAYFLSDINRRKISNGVIQALEHGLPVLYPSDSGASQILAENGYKYEIEKISCIGDEVIKKLQKNNCKIISDMKIFAEKLVGK